MKLFINIISDIIILTLITVFHDRKKTPQFVESDR